jgi:ABC-2 type transport system permease protein
MLTDIATVARKELAEILFPDGGLRGSARNVIVLLGIAGVWFPLQAGTAWFTSWTTVGSACFPLLLVLNYTIDAFAGERERHTLETLLASRLDGRSILLGKTLAIVLYGWGLVVSALPIGLVAVNIADRGPGFLFFRPAIVVSILVLGLLVALLLCTIGVLVSLAAPTVRIAGQRMLVPFFAVFSLPFCVPYLLKRTRWEQAIVRLDPVLIAALVAAGCLVVAGVVLAIGLKRFDRERLTLA